ncbi:core-2/I-branching enzyme-domain-containing protein [Cladochytrium replicatum]|nr:core-2/I-branching enzyme-domain-containing protein [Cladochytrium replicatum]
MRELNNTEDLMRFSCYEASLGNNMFVGNGLVNRERYDRGIDENPSMLHLRPFLMHVHGPTYFPFLDGMLEDFDDMARQSASSSWCKYEHGPNPQNGIELVSRHSVAGKPHYQLAYLILGYQSAANVQILLDRLWHPTDVIIGIHIDLDSREKKVEVEKHVQRYYPGATNIIFIDPVRVIWGNISIVFAQLRGFFQLLKVATWDHIINLSENDYPLVTNRRIHTNIRKNVNYIMWHQEKLRGAQTSRLRTVCLKYSENGAKCRYATPAGAAPEVKLYLRRQFPCGEWNTELKNSQWMILSQAFVESIRISPAAANLLAFVEHTFIPDESYFALIAAHSPWGGVYLDEDDSVSDNAEPRQQRYRNDRHNLGLEDERTEAKRAQLQSFWTEKRNHRFLKMKGPHPEKLTMRTFSTVAKKLCGPSAVLRPDEKNAKTLYCKGLEGEMLGETYFFARKITLSQEVDGLVKYIDENFNLGPLGRNIFSATRIRNSTRKFSRLNSNFRIP